MRKPSAAILVTYLGISLLCFITPSVELFMSGLNNFPGLLWLFGPPAMLVYQLDYFVVYLVETAIFLAVAAVSVYGFRREEPLMAIGGLLAGGVVWVVCGVLAYSPAF